MLVRHLKFPFLFLAFLNQFPFPIGQFWFFCCCDVFFLSIYFFLVLLRLVIYDYIGPPPSFHSKASDSVPLFCITWNFFLYKSVVLNSNYIELKKIVVVKSFERN